MIEVRLFRHPDEQAALARLHGLPPNFDVRSRGGFTEANGWHRDDDRQPLPAEAPGPPEADGSWESARRLVRDYAFADPSLVRAVYDRDEPLERRVMLLELRLSALRFYVGVRVDEVTDELRELDGRQARVWGWSYLTLEGHVEMGRRFFEVWKWLDTGAVEFRTWSFSRTAVRGPVLRLGFALFGRHRQAEFGRRACERIDRLVRADLARRPPREPSLSPERLTGIYLDDHLALLTGAVELAKRVGGAAAHPEIRAFLVQLLPELRDDRAAAEELSRTLGHAPSRAKQALARLGVKGGLLKTNGNPFGPSPLTRVVELEGIRFVLEGDRALWRAIERVGPDRARADAARRAARLDASLERAEELRLLAAEVALGGGDDRL